MKRLHSVYDAASSDMSVTLEDLIRSRSSYRVRRTVILQCQLGFPLIFRQVYDNKSDIK